MKSIYKILFVPLLLIFVSNVVVAGDKYSFDVKSFTTRDGLPHNYINAMFQDSDGFMWFATRNGVCRYDGYNFEWFKTDLQNTFIPKYSQDIFESDDGTLWVLGPVFAYYYDGRDFHTVSNNYTIAYPDKSGNIWFIYKDELIKVDINVLSEFLKNDKRLGANIKILCKEKNDRIWIFENFTRKQLVIASQGFYEKYTPKEKGVIKPLIDKLYIDYDKEKIWVSSSNVGLLSFNINTGEFKDYSQGGEGGGLSNNHIYNVFEYDSVFLWIGTMDGVNELNRKTGIIRKIFTEDDLTKPLSDNVVTCFYKTREGELFIGTRYGLNLLTDKKFEHYYKKSSKNSLISNNVHGFIEQDAKEMIVISSGGIDKMDVLTKSFEHFMVLKTGRHRLPASPISIVKDQTDNYWVGTWQGGLFNINMNSGSYRQYVSKEYDENSLSSNNIMTMHVSNSNDLWIGTWGGGVNYYDRKSKIFTRYSNDVLDENTLSGNNVSGIITDKYGRLWIATTSGLNLMIDKDKGLFKRFYYSKDDDNSLSNNLINTIFCSGDYLWIGTNYGLSRLNIIDFSIKRYFKKDGLPSNTIKALINDNRGNLWVSTNKGIAKITFDDSDNILKIYTFSVSEGLQDNEFLERSVYKSNDGYLYFGGTNGFNRFNPENIAPDTTLPICIFTNFIVDDKVVRVNDTIFGSIVLTKPLSKTKHVTLSYKHKSFAIEFAGLKFSNPENISYMYMLKGFDNEWKKVDAAHRKAVYTNINKGEYVFLLKTGGVEGIRSSEPVSLRIVIKPPFWRTTWFFILFSIFVLALIYFLVELRLRMIKRQRKELEVLVKERTKQIVEQKNSIEKQKDEIKRQAEHIARMNELLKENNIKLKDNLEHLSKARVMQKLLDYNEFKRIFHNEEQCYQYLINLKWGNGFKCVRCGNEEYSLEENNSRRCKKCNYKESTTSGTIFHHLRFPIDKAFYILIVTSTGRKINISELSRTLDLRLKTVWNFHNKVKDEMQQLKAPIKSDEGWAALIITPPKKHKNKFK